MLENKKKYTPRHRSRIYSICALYHYEINPLEPEQILENIKQFYPDKPKIYYFTEELFRKTIENLERIDGLMTEHLKNWTIERLLIIDKNILRLGLTEIFYFDSIPVEVSINEAIELGHLWGTQDSPKFINAILDSIGNENHLLKKYYENSGHK